MIKFFRKIRQQLLVENKTGKYFKYAIGEIVLVVIGILIALQINTWNEEREDKIKEKVILEDLLENIERNIVILDTGVEQLENLNRSSSIILRVLQQNLPYADSLDSSFFNALIRGELRLNLTQDGYEMYKNAGFDAIRSSENFNT